MGRFGFWRIGCVDSVEMSRRSVRLIDTKDAEARGWGAAVGLGAVITDAATKSRAEARQSYDAEPSLIITTK